jgi:hypothetical protein
MSQWHRELSKPRRNPESMSDDTKWFSRIYSGDAVFAAVYGRTQEEASSRAEGVVAALKEVRCNA